MDLTIPGGLGGRETVKRLAAIDPGVKAIVSSGFLNDPIMSDNEAFCFKAVLIKPYRIREMGETLQRVIKGQGRPEGAG